MVSAYDERPWLALYSEDMPPELRPEHNSILDLFQAARRAHPDRIAITYFDGQLTYREVDELSDGLAAYLRERGFATGDRLALYLQNVPQFVIGVLGGWKAGGIVVPLNPMYRSHELTGILADSTPTAVLCAERGWRDVLRELAEPAGVRIVVTTSELDLQARHDPRLFTGFEHCPDPSCADLMDVARRHGARSRAVAGPSETALLVYTSGTSGTPKGAATTHGNLAFNVEGFRQRTGLPEGGVVFGLAPLFHITGMVCQLGAVFALAGTLNLVYRFAPGIVLDALTEHRPHYMIGPSTAYVALQNHPDATREHFASLEQIYSGGAPLPAAVVDRFEEQFGRYIHNGYGLTETTATATSVPVGSRAPVDPTSGTLSVGIPTFNAVLRIVDDDGADLPVGEVGEIVVAGPMVVPAYWNKPAETAEAISDGRLHTGDVGFMDERGWFYVVDRKKDMINASGFKVWPREVEDVLYTHPAVEEAAVVGVPDAYRGETVRAHVSARDGVDVTAEELVAFCKQRLAAYKYPRSIRIHPELPKTTTGKILRRELRDHDHAAPASSTE